MVTKIKFSSNLCFSLFYFGIEKEDAITNTTNVAVRSKLTNKDEKGEIRPPKHPITQKLHLENKTKGQ